MENLPVFLNTDAPLGQQSRSAAAWNFERSYGSTSRRGDGLSNYIDIIREHKKLAVAAFVVIFGLIAIYTFFTTPIYRSAAILKVQDEAIQDPQATVRDPGDSGFERRVETEVGMLRSRFLAEQLVAKMELMKSGDFFPPEILPVKWIRQQLSYLFSQMEPKSEEAEQVAKRDKIIKAIGQRLSVRQLGKSGLLEVGLESKFPVTAQLMLRNYLEIYFTSKLDVKRGESLRSLAWLKGEIEKAQNELMQSELALLKFASEHGIDLSDDGGLNQVSETIKKKKEGLLKAQELQAKLKGLKDVTNAGAFNVRSDVAQDETLRKLKEDFANLETERARVQGLYGKHHPTYIVLEQRIKLQKQRIANWQKEAVRSALESVQEEENVLKSGVRSAQEEALRLGSFGARYAILKKDVDINDELHRMLVKEYKETNIKARTAQTNISIVDPANLPIEPVWPRKKLFLIVGGVLGLFGSLMTVSIAHFIEGISETANRAEEEFEVIRLGTVPDVSKLKKLHRIDDSTYDFVAYDRPNSPLADSIRNIHAGILFSPSCENAQAILISSLLSGEGKTFIAVSLSTALSCNNTKKAIVVDCDLRKPSIHGVFGAPADCDGLTDLLTSDDANVDSVIRRHHIPGLFFLTAGSRVHDHLSLLMSERFGEVVRELRDRFDFVIFDAPPMLGFPEIRILTPYSDGVLLVVREGYASRAEYRSGADIISSCNGTRILGLVVNKARPQRSPYKYGGYYYYGENRR